jgi:lipopolysaccharide/colanic/teichoic acid biosynthesis glycosyltransferase
MVTTYVHAVAGDKLAGTRRIACSLKRGCDRLTRLSSVHLSSPSRVVVQKCIISGSGCSTWFQHARPAQRLWYQGIC